MKYLINKFLQLLKIIIIFRTGHALGEQLYISSFVKKIKKNNRLFVMTTCPELFYYNPDIYKIININKNNLLKKILIYLMKHLLGSNIILFYPKKFQNINNKNYLNFYSSSKHVIEINSERANIKYNSMEIRNFFYFSAHEEILFRKKFSFLKNYKLIQSETKTSFTNNKNWNVKNFQEVINYFPEKNWVQIGSDKDKKLSGVIDLTGKTSIRELAFLIKNSEYIICLEGFFAHLSSCFDTKAYVIYSGIVPLSNLLYKNIIPISKSKNLSCSPCYLIDDCPQKKKYCTENILANDVIEIIKNK